MLTRKVLFLLTICGLAMCCSAQCNTEVAVLNEGNCECNDETLWYDYLNNLCTAKTEFYKFGGCGPFSRANGDACECLDAFALNTATGECEDLNDCENTVCANTEECRTKTGSEYCKCTDIYYRGDNSLCSYLDESLNPQWHDCTQLAYDRTSGYVCSCFNNNMFVLADDGKTCEIQPGYTECADHNDAGALCVNNTATGEISYFALPGFQLDSQNQSQDIDECELPETVCWQNSECSNLEEGRGYDCECLPGYTDSIFNNDTMKECYPVTCGRGEGVDCLNACDDFICPSEDSFCLVEENEPECEDPFYKTTCDTSDEEWNLFSGSFSTWNPEESPGQVTESLEMVFGEGAVQLEKQSDQRYFATVMSSIDAATNGMRLSSYCDELEHLPDFCELPGGIIIKNDTLNLNIIDVCEEDSLYTLCLESTRCDNGATGLQSGLNGSTLNIIVLSAILAWARCYF